MIDNKTSKKTSYTRKIVKLLHFKNINSSLKLPVTFMNSQLRKSTNQKTIKNPLISKTLLNSREQLKQNHSTIDCFQIYFKNKSFQSKSSLHLKTCINPIVSFPCSIPHYTISSSLYQAFMKNNNILLNQKFNLDVNSTLMNEET